jgi:colanic acid/amylovoran biosynthesis protein
MPSEIDVIIDASGFAYGDQWGAEKATMRLAGNIRQFKADTSHRVIMLPQAFGPFKDEALKKAMHEILEHSDLTFAREKQSHEYLDSIKSSPQLRIAPDFTNLYRPVSKWQLDRDNMQICFIANAKMLEMKGSEQGRDYIQFMADLVKRAAENQLKPFMLLHEGDKDKALAEQIIQHAGSDIPLISPPTADDVKQVIGQAKLVISSRFHGLVSGLSQGVPVLATGWSHKYLMLLKDYGIEQHLYNESTDIEQAAKAMLALATDSAHYEDVVAKIKTCGAEQKQLTSAMWEQVYQVIEEVVR